MALRLRRGTNVERQLLTPLEGELIYTTDTKSLYVGDGVTLGGVLIAASGEVSNTLSGLLDTDIVGLQDGDVLVYNGTTGEWSNNQSALDIDDLNDVLLTSAVNGDVLFYDGVNWKNINFDSLVDSSSTIQLDDIQDVVIQGTPENGHVLFHDGNIFKNVPASTLADTILSSQQTHTLTLKGNDSTILVDPVTNTFTGELQGDAYGSLYDGLGNLIIDEFSKAAMVDVRDPTNTHTVLDNFTGELRRGETGDVIIQGGANPVFIGNLEGAVKGAIVGPDLQIILNHDNATLFGSVSGSLRGDDSTVVFDGATGKFNLDDTIVGNIGTRNQDAVANLTLVRESTSDLSASSVSLGQIAFGVDDSNGAKTGALITGNKDSLYLMADGTGTFTNGALAVTLTDGLLAIGSFGPATEKLDVIGNIKASGSIQPGVYADNTARDAAITSPVAGMMVFNSAGAKFQGYDGTAWVDLN
jgi:hypothetical protein